MLKDLELTIGKSYVREDNQSVFEVVDLRDYRVAFKTYDLESSELRIPPRACNKLDFLRMVDRAATQAEMASLQPAASIQGHAPDRAKKSNPRLEDLKHMQNITIAR